MFCFFGTTGDSVELKVQFNMQQRHFFTHMNEHESPRQLSINFAIHTHYLNISHQTLLLQHLTSIFKSFHNMTSAQGTIAFDYSTSRGLVNSLDWV